MIISFESTIIVFIWRLIKHGNFLIGPIKIWGHNLISGTFFLKLRTEDETGDLKKNEEKANPVNLLFALFRCLVTLVRLFASIIDCLLQYRCLLLCGYLTIMYDKEFDYIHVNSSLLWISTCKWFIAYVTYVLLSSYFIGWLRWLLGKWVFIVS